MAVFFEHSTGDTLRLSRHHATTPLSVMAVFSRIQQATLFVCHAITPPTLSCVTRRHILRLQHYYATLNNGRFFVFSPGDTLSSATPLRHTPYLAHYICTQVHV